jgi:hypothetical protein
MRGAFWEALCILAKDNQNSVPEELAAWIKATPPEQRPKWLASMSAFRAREKTIKGEVHHRHTIELPQLQDAARKFLAELAPRPAIDGDVIEGACATGSVLLDHEDSGTN